MFKKDSNKLNYKKEVKKKMLTAIMARKRCCD